MTDDAKQGLLCHRCEAKQAIPGCPWCRGVREAYAQGYAAGAALEADPVRRFLAHPGSLAVARRDWTDEDGEAHVSFNAEWCTVDMETLYEHAATPELACEAALRALDGEVRDGDE